MFEFFNEKTSPLILALSAGIYTWLSTAIGASLVLFVKNVSRKLLDTSLGFAAGIMIAASFWSLLDPAIELSEKLNTPTWIPPTVGFLLGAAFLRIIDKILPHLHFQAPMSEVEGIKTSFKRTTLLVLAVTLHNIPEGLAVGVSFGAYSLEPNSVSLISSIVLALGIGIQNIPEGFAISLPLRSEGFSKKKSFFIGQLSGIVEPLFAVVGFLFVGIMENLLPMPLDLQLVQ